MKANITGVVASILMIVCLAGFLWCASLLFSGCSPVGGDKCWEIMYRNGTTAHTKGHRVELDRGHLYLYVSSNSNDGGAVFNDVLTYRRCDCED